AKGQLFCDEKSWQIIDMLRSECEKNGTIFKLETSIQSIEKQEESFLVTTESDTYRTQSLVVACGGLSIPKIGATGFGYDIAKQFGLNIIPTRAALVPLTFDEELLSKTKELSGISVDAKVNAGKGSFAEGLLFTHKGLSGPSILQVSSYWQDNTAVTVDMLPSEQIEDVLKKAKNGSPKKQIQNIIAQYLPQRLADMITDTHNVTGKNMADLSDKTITSLAQNINAWKIIPNGTEGYRTAEVTIGGVDTKELSSQTMEARKVSGLYFIGEVVDVTGHLGGHNFQWAWASGHAAGQAV
ncbi:MAG TPA: aminoacetone oxidase family FAD-binding enzyme, partial [Micavibrio sp.]|nr:aminoacetone oxidase family FAD-binding enzyme [Micavibrio sp.]